MMNFLLKLMDFVPKVMGAHAENDDLAGWGVRVRELAVDQGTSRNRCIKRNYAGKG